MVYQARLHDLFLSNCHAVMRDPAMSISMHSLKWLPLSVLNSAAADSMEEKPARCHLRVVRQTGYCIVCLLLFRGNLVSNRGMWN